MAGTALSIMVGKAHDSRSSSVVVVACVKQLVTSQWQTGSRATEVGMTLSLKGPPRVTFLHQTSVTNWNTQMSRHRSLLGTFQIQIK